MRRCAEDILRNYFCNMEKGVAYTAHADDLRARWMDSPMEMPGRSGWNLLIDRITRHKTRGLNFDAILNAIARPDR